MEMDIPLPDELEWLEADSHLHEDHLHPPSPDPYPPDDDDGELPPPPVNSHKRPRPSDSPTRPEDEPPALLQSDEKRTKLDSPSPSEADDHWLRYSPADGSRVPAEPEPAPVEETILSRYVSEIDGDFVPVTAPSGGDRVYAKICRFEWEEIVTNMSRPVSRFNDGGLLVEPINVLLNRVEQEALTKALRASSEVQSDSVVPKTNVAPDRLWVDKYAPNSFTELLSDEQTNREVLLWLKHWDSTVFGSEIRSTSDDVFSALRRHSSVAKHHKPSESTIMIKNGGQRWKNGSARQSNEMDNKNVNFKGGQELQKKQKLAGPPEHKILLLCGPPGLGKTTLAHVAAKHCGYRVVEINASDERSTSVIEAKILDVVQMNSVTADSRPKCLVIDEIDGALSDGKGAVEVILKMLKSDNRKGNTETREHSGKIASKKGQKMASMLRPIICICNDLYAPALRPLRQMAKVHIFVQPTVTRVVNRLKYICNEEGMKVSSIALTVLAEYTECDIRSCLNTLQFLNKKKETLNVFEISAQVVGQKDVSRSAFDIWKEIFQRRKMKPNKKSDSRRNSMSNEFDSLFSLVSNRGDYDIILDGIHENILQMKYHDPVMKKTVKCFNAIGTSDLMHQHALRNQQMTLLAYQPLLATKIHQLIAQFQKPNIEWPKSYQRCRTTQMEKMETLQSWRNQMPPYISRHLTCKSFAEDLITPLLHVLSPSTLRPVALHLLSEKDKNDLAQLVSIMISYSVTYKNMKTDPLAPHEQAASETSLTLAFDPPLHEFVGFKGYCSDHYVLPLAMKQVLVHEVEKQRILLLSKSTNLTDGVNKENNDIQVGQSKGESVRGLSSILTSNFNHGEDSMPRQSKPCSSAAPTMIDSSRPVAPNVTLTGNARKPSRASASFFDRFRKASVKTSDDAGNAAQNGSPLQGRDSLPVQFKFNEGFTNAIKRPVRMRDFLS